MTQEDLHEHARRQPFVPFRVLLTTGLTFEVPHPELILVGRRSAVFGLPRNPEDKIYDRTVVVDLFHIVSIEPVVNATPMANGFQDDEA